MSDTYGELLGILARHGSRLMARHALEAACKRVNLPPGTIPDDRLEQVVELTMESFRVFCDDKTRRACWLDLIDLIEARR